MTLDLIFNFVKLIVTKSTEAPFAFRKPCIETIFPLVLIAVPLNKNQLDISEKEGLIPPLFLLRVLILVLSKTFLDNDEGEAARGNGSLDILLSGCYFDFALE